MSAFSPAEDRVLIEALARKAGAMAARMRSEGLKVTSKPGGSPVTDADVAVDQMLQRELLAARPDYGWLSEEIADDGLRLQRSRVFIVDPIDGTSAFVRRKPWYAVSIAVVENGETIAGAVYAPELDELYSAATGEGALLNGAPIRSSDRDALADISMLGDPKMFTHPDWPSPWPAMRVESRNSVAYRMCLVASGAFDAAYAPSGKSDWDIAAADLIVREAGGVVIDGAGERFVYNRPQSRHLGLICAGPRLAALILDQVRHIQAP